MSAVAEASAVAAPAAPRTADPAWRIDWIAVPRVHVALLAVLSLLLAVFATANIQYVPESADSQTNFSAGIVFGETGTIAPQPGEIGWHMREPFVPMVIGAYHVLRGAAGLSTVSLDCISKEAQVRRECMEATAPYRHVSVAFILVAAVSAFLLVYGTLGSAIPAYVAFLASGTSSMLFNGLTRFVTEAPAAALMTLAAVLLCLLVARRRLRHALALGACLAALTLTKVVFAWLWVVVGALLIALALSQRGSALRLAWLAAVAALVNGLLCGAWMTRNYLTAESFRLMDGRSYRVLSVRASYNEMRTDEWLTGFVYFLPYFTEKQVEAMGFPRSSFERFNSANAHSFRRAGQERYKADVVEERRIAALSGAGPDDRRIFDLLSKRYRDMMLADPVAHLRVSVLLAYLSTFPELGYGMNFPSKIGRLGDGWSLSVPDWGYRLSRAQLTWLNGATTIAILAIPFVLYLRNRNIGGLVIALPVLYSHGVYAIASHFNVRYARPEIPLRNVALCILVWLAVTALVMLVRRHAMRRIEGAATAEAP